jgi:hypothetical protein
MRRFTIRGLMVLVVGLAVAIAALRHADDYWAGGLLLAAPLLIGIATLGAICLHASGKRSFAPGRTRVTIRWSNPHLEQGANHGE